MTRLNLFFILTVKKLLQEVFCLLAIFFTILICANQAIAHSPNVSPNPNTDLIATLWMFLAGVLVFLLNIGFALVEAGLCRTSYVTNILVRNLIVFCVAAFAYWLIGFSLMFGDNNTTNLNSFSGHVVFPLDTLFVSSSNQIKEIEGFSDLQEKYPNQRFIGFFFLQSIFAVTTVTIVSRAVTERIKFWAFILFSFCLIISYGITSHWVWSSDGWLLNNFKFRDFAGSTVIHSVGGVSALVGAILLKPRHGRFGYHHQTNQFNDQETVPFSSSNLEFAVLGCFLIVLGWFGFHGGAVLNLESIPLVVVTTMMAGVSGGISAMLLSYFRTRNPKPISIINGILGGLVGITASSGYVSIYSAIFIGFVSGVIVVEMTLRLERKKIDDPCGAIPVHLGCGFWGTIAVGIFSDTDSLEYKNHLFHNAPGSQILSQLFGWIVVCTFTGLFSWVIFLVIGIFFYYGKKLLQLLNNQVNQGSIFGKKSTQKFNFKNLVDFFKQIPRRGREGLRVSVEQETNGGDIFFD